MADQSPKKATSSGGTGSSKKSATSGGGGEKKKRRLGRGLGSLIPVPVEAPASSQSVAPPPATGEVPLSSSGIEVPQRSVASAAVPEQAEPTFEEGGQLQRLGVDSIVPNAYQPRQEFDSKALDELAASIQQSGLVQPIVVRSTGNPASWELVAGERRLRAMKQLGWVDVPALVMEVGDREAAELALVENVHREDLNPVERAQGLARLRDGFSLTQKALAERVGLDRSSVANLLRILELDEFSLAAVKRGSLSLGHAKALLAIDEPTVRRATAAASINGNWSVRELERRVRALLDSASMEPGTEKSPITTRQANVVDLERRLTESLGLRVQISLGRKKGTGTIRIGFETLEEFDHLTERLGLPGS